jgi:Holliday junction resolvasome RuvABC endonuclease subunit
LIYKGILSMKCSEIKRFIGIDPGLTGAIGIVNIDNSHRSVRIIDLPVLLHIDQKSYTYNRKTDRILKLYPNSVWGDYINNHPKERKLLILKGNKLSTDKLSTGISCSINEQANENPYSLRGNPYTKQITPEPKSKSQPKSMGGITPTRSLSSARPFQSNRSRPSIIDFQQVRSILLELLSDKLPTLILIENQYARPVQGVTSAFSLGYSFGGLMSTLASLNVPFLVEDPNAWKRKLDLLGSDKQRSV